MITRRNFHSQLACLVGGSIASSRFVFADQAPSTIQGRRLVTVFLQGGNDGLNTVIPALDPLYRHYRPELSINPEKAISLDRDMFLHPSLQGLGKVWEAGRLRIQQGVGYPGHSRSHFESSAVWSEGRLNARSPSFDGWLARTLDPLQQSSESPLACAIDSTETPELLRGRLTRTTTLPKVPSQQAARLAKRLQPMASTQNDNELHQLVDRARRDATDALRRSSESQRSQLDFPETEFGQRIRQVATVIDAMPDVRAIHVRHEGYDTHSAQRGRHAGLLRELGDGLRALDNFLAKSGNSESTLVMVFSEFGRRVQENASIGTDHGAAGPVLFLGGVSQPGLFGSNPNLEQLVRGDVAVSQDLREIHQGIASWLVANDDSLALPGNG